jgi:hypothetical protein
MQVLSREEAAEVLRTPDIESFVGGVDWQYPDPVPSYFLLEDSGAKVGLARVIANTFLDRGPAVLWFTEFGIWSGAEHVDLFTRYRLSFGETRTLAAAPAHIFEPKGDRDSFISILSIGLFFVWGFEIISQDRSLAMTISHDEWLEYRFARGQEDFISYFEKWIAPNLRGSATTSKGEKLTL